MIADISHIPEWYMGVFFWKGLDTFEVLGYDNIEVVRQEAKLLLLTLANKGADL